jgi:glyoxylase-like metal-dependent hydrolase (beta-lactamase superfamily II)
MAHRAWPHRVSRPAAVTAESASHAAAQIDGSATDRARCVLAPNPSPMTLDGTNTWLVCEPRSATALVVDPGPDDIGHLARIRAIVAERGQRVQLIVLTHRHSDHSAGAARLASLTGAPVLAIDPAYRLGSEGLTPGDVVDAGGCELRVIATPGHSSDSVCLHIPADDAVLTGDTVLGRGTTVIAADGSLADYLDSLRRLRALADATSLRALLPGHGPLLTDPAGALDFYLAHRAERLAEVQAALAAGDQSPSEIVARVYAEVDRGLWQFAESSVRAQLDYLHQRGDVPPDVHW